MRKRLWSALRSGLVGGERWSADSRREPVVGLADDDSADPTLPRVPKLVPGGFDLYEWSLARGSFTIADATSEFACGADEIALIVGNLLALHLVHRFHGRDDGFVPVDPVIAATSLLAPVEVELLDRQTSVNQFRIELERMAALFRASPFGSRQSATVDVVQDVEVVRSLLRKSAATCTSEVLSMQPGGGRSAHELAEARERDLELLGRGMRMRVLYQHTARFDQVTREHVALLSAAGAQFRTAEALFARMIVFDRSVAFIPADDVVLGAAAVVRDPTLVGFFYSCFEHAWVAAKDFDARSRAVDSISDDLKGEIVRMLVDGAKDDAIARRLGLSVRTTRKHIAQLMQRYDAASRFQFGYAVMKHNLFPES